MIGNEWDEVLKEEFEKDYFLKIKEFIDEEYKQKQSIPQKMKYSMPSNYVQLTM